MPGTCWAAQPPLQVPLPAGAARGLALLATRARSCFVWLGWSWGIPGVPAQQTHLMDCCSGAGGVTAVPRGCCARAGSDVEPGLGLFADQTWEGSTGGGLGDRVRSGPRIVGREGPEEAAGSWAFVYFCQIPFGQEQAAVAAF